MSAWTMQSYSDDPRILPGRLGRFLRRQGSAKQLALRLGCDQRTAEKFRAGDAWPIAKHMLSIWLEFGDDVVEAVFYPERVEARLAREAEEREQARRRRLSSLTMGDRSLRMADVLDEALGEDEGPAELGPPNLDLFEQFAP